MPYLRKLPSGKWQATYRDHDGARHSVTRPTKAQARDEAQDLETQVRRGDWQDPARGRITIREWHDEHWWPARHTAPSTAKRDAGAIRNHVLPRWENSQLARVSKLDVQRWVSDMTRAGLGAPTVHTAHNLLCLILEAAADDDRITSAAVRRARDVNLPRIVSKPPRVLARDERGELFAGLDEEEDKRLVQVDLGTGLRWEEITGLRCKWVELARLQLHVVEVHTRHGFGPPKTAASERAVSFSTHTAALLEKQMTGKGPDDLVFAALGGGPIHYHNWRGRVWAKAVRGMAAPTPSIHSMRHTYISDLLAAGVSPRTVQGLSGHASLRSLERYAHFVPEAGERARQVLEELDRP